MPLSMVNLWLGIGSVLIAVVMLAAMLLPRPNAEYAISELPFRIGSPDQTSSPYGTGREGVKENQPSARNEPGEAEQPGSARPENRDKSPAGDQKGQAADDNNPAKQDEKNNHTQSERQNEPRQQSSASNEKPTDQENHKETKPPNTGSDSEDNATPNSRNDEKESSQNASGKQQGDKQSPDNIYHTPTVSRPARRLISIGYKI